MSMLVFIVVTAVAALATVTLRPSARGSGTVGAIGLVVAIALAAGLRADDPVTIGDTVLAGSPYAGLFLALLAAAGLLLAVASATPRAFGDLAAATLATLACAAIVLATADLLIAVAVATAAGVIGVVATLGSPTIRSVVVAARELRALLVAGTFAVGAVAWTTRPDTAAADPALLGLAYLAGAAAVAIRFGAIPFHLWAARVPDAAAETVLPLVMTWGPAILAVAALGWIESSVAGTGSGLGFERSIVVIVAALTVVLAAVAATVHDDLEHIVGYGIIADAGFIVLALATLDPAVREPARTYLLAYVLVKTAFAGWAAGARLTFGVRRLGDLGGWARRNPLLAVGLVGVTVAGIGLPGVAVWEARAAIAEAALDGPPVWLFVLAGLAPALYLGRLLAVGYGRTTATVASSPHPWPRQPAHPRPRDARSVISWVMTAWDENRAPIAALAVIVMAGVALTVAAGGLGVREAAAAFGAAVAPAS